MIAASILAAFCFILVFLLIWRRQRRCGSAKITRKKRIQWLYWMRPRVFLTRHEYVEALEADIVGKHIIKRRNSTYVKLPLCKVRCFCKKLYNVSYLFNCSTGSKPILSKLVRFPIKNQKTLLKVIDRVFIKNFTNSPFVVVR